MSALISTRQCRPHAFVPHLLRAYPLPDVDGAGVARIEEARASPSASPAERGG